MFVEHQSTSETKIHNLAAHTRALLLNYAITEITVVIVIIRNHKKVISSNLAANLFTWIFIQKGISY